MPGWQLPDQQIWQLVAFIRNLPITAAPAEPPAQPATPGFRRQPTTSARPPAKSATATFMRGGKRRRWPTSCAIHASIPEAIIPDLASGDPLMTFTKDDIAFVYGSKWKQRYFKKVGDDYYLLPAQWDVTHKKWKPYFVKDDWWAPLYPPDNFQRPTGALCDGCHSVNYDIKTKAVTEWNVGCEKCHGPGSEHVEPTRGGDILNPSRMDYVAANDICIQCHSQGRPAQDPIDGKYYDWPVGLRPVEKAERLLEAGRAQARRNHLHPFRRRHRAQEPDAGQRLRHQPDVHARRHLLHLPRRAWDGLSVAISGSRRARSASTATARIHRTARTRPRWRSTRITSPAAPEALASPATCRRSRKPSAT